MWACTMCICITLKQHQFQNSTSVKILRQGCYKIIDNISVSSLKKTVGQERDDKATFKTRYSTHAFTCRPGPAPCRQVNACVEYPSTLPKIVTSHQKPMKTSSTNSGPSLIALTKNLPQIGASHYENLETLINRGPYLKTDESPDNIQRWLQGELTVLYSQGFLDGADIPKYSWSWPRSNS